MRILGLCVVKNEDDIIEEGLKAARKWADQIFVLDNGSIDRTWEIVQDLAAEDNGIIAWKSQDVPFHDGIRADIFHHFKDLGKPGDWWARVDPDEFYVEDPRVFLGRVDRSVACVWYASLSFYFSTKEKERYERRPEDFAASASVMEKCRHYFNHWSELRFVRHEAMTPWDGRGGWPEGLEARTRSHPRRILCRHFPYRSPEQIEKRLATRRASAVGGQVFSHEAIADWSRVVDPRAVQQHRWSQVEYIRESEKFDGSWQSRVIDHRALEFDAHDGRFKINEDLMPPIPGVRPSLLSRLSYDRVKGKLRRMIAGA